MRIAFIVGVSLIVGLAGAGISLILPNQYTAKGLLIVTRKADEPDKEIFTYEGNYAQQNAGAYTTTFLAILQSPANLETADTGLDVKKLTQLVKTKREGSQGIALNVRGATPEQASILWGKISDSAINIHQGLKPNADPLIFISITPGSPTVLKTYPGWQTVLGAGFAFCAVILVSVIIIIRYLKGEYDH